ncbi:MAG: phosphatidylserine decarboxylase family protein [Candidatus Marinimicrobia bacterium]|nr:phosphatidylserine decarboxylase family protein [Candidatus Neomarinimicrobiota bacterium]MCH7954581.1 phosphatidylserine decarboxylase family protein [Candidatus Neomarinimicrobiota bacterium]
MASDGIPFVAAAGFVLVALGFAASMTGSVFLWGLTYTEALLLLFIVFFFRDPDRTIPKGDNLVLSVGDGKVVVIKEVNFPELSEDNFMQVSVFLSVFDVHVNRVPVSGTVHEVKYFAGKFLAAWNEKASLDNEQSLISVDTGTKRVYFKQIAGLIARRIVYDLKPGQSVEAGDRFGLIRFGSRVDILLPMDAEISVKLGDRVKGGETVIGVLKIEVD